MTSYYEFESNCSSTTIPRVVFNDFSVTGRVDIAPEMFLSFSLSKEQYAIVEPNITRCRLAGGFHSAVEFLVNRDVRLQAECAASDGELEYPYCASYVNSELAVYETTSGTLLSVSKDGNYKISLPIDRQGGHHHKIIILVLAGITADQLSHHENLHVLHEDGNEALYVELAALYDAALMPYGYEPQISWQQREDDRKAGTAADWSWSPTYASHNDYKG